MGLFHKAIFPMLFFTRNQGPNSLQWKFCLDIIGEILIIRLGHPDDIVCVPNSNFKEMPGCLLCKYRCVAPPDDQKTLFCIEVFNNPLQFPENVYRRR